MSDYTVTVPDDGERGVRVECEAHGEHETFPAGYRSVAFYCDRCGREVEITLHDPHDPRDLGERC